jgi:flagellar hook protein FlgE
MDVIANNISNVNTAGYKTSRVTFYDVFNQTLSSASRADPATQRGGRNPMQIGLGANVASIDQIMTTGATQRTDWSLDLMIQGEGFFILSDESGYYFTRAGAFRVDEQGNLTNPSGLLVNGWMRVKDTDPNSPTYGQWTIPQGKVAPIQITPDMEYTAPEATSMIDMAGNLNAATNGTAGYTSTMSFYDTVGNRYVVDVTYKYTPATATADGYWTMTPKQVEDPAAPNTFKTQAYLASDPKKTFLFDISFGARDLTPPETTKPTWPAAGPIADTSITPQFRFDENGNVIPLQIPATAPATGTVDSYQMVMYVRSVDPLLPDAEFGMMKTNTDATTGEAITATNDQIIINFGDMRQVNATSDVTGKYVDGKEPGELIRTAVSETGVLTGIYSNGLTEELAQIAITQFKNPAGLEKMGNSLFLATSNSGLFDGIGVPPGSNGSSLLSGSLEMSNVDLSQEFTEMITTQRGFQANSRVITTSDDMLQELVNLKR